MSERKDQLKKVFADTQLFYKEDQVLAEAVEYGRQHTKLYEADDYPEISCHRLTNDPGNNQCEIRNTKPSARDGQST